MIETAEIRRVADLSKQAALAERDAEGLRVKRDRAIRKALEKGHSQRDIAGVSGLTHGRIGQIGQEA